MLFQAQLATTDCIVITFNFYVMLLIKYSLLKNSSKYYKPGLVKNFRKTFFQVFKVCSRFLKLHVLGSGFFFKNKLKV